MTEGIVERLPMRPKCDLRGNFMWGKESHLVGIVAGDGSALPHFPSPIDNEDGARARIIQPGVNAQRLFDTHLQTSLLGDLAGGALGRRFIILDKSGRE